LPAPSKEANRNHYDCRHSRHSTLYNEDRKKTQGLGTVMKWIIVLVLLLVIGSLGSALYFMMKDKGNSSRMVHSLMLRIGLSIALFIGIWIAYYFGLIQSTGLKVAQ
jgi:hypothetical protein